MVAFMLEKNMNDVNLQLQMHKFIWDPEERGV
jgi:7-carboxy-7-deazaguanine synthase